MFSAVLSFVMSYKVLLMYQGFDWSRDIQEDPWCSWNSTLISLPTVTQCAQDTGTRLLPDSRRARPHGVIESVERNWVFASSIESLDCILVV